MSSLEEIKARLKAITKLGEWETTRSNDVVIYAPMGFGAYRLVAHVDTADDAKFISNSPADMAKLLEIVDSVLEVADWCDAASSDKEVFYAEGKVSARIMAKRLREAVSLD